MTDKQIARMKQFLFHNRIFWNGVNGMREIVHIAPHKEEPSECGAFFDGGYIALYNADVADLWLCTPLCLD